MDNQETERRGRCATCGFLGERSLDLSQELFVYEVPEGGRDSGDVFVQNIGVFPVFGGE